MYVSMYKDSLCIHYNDRLTGCLTGGGNIPSVCTQYGLYCSLNEKTPIRCQLLNDYIDDKWYSLTRLLVANLFSNDFHLLHLILS